MHFDNAQVYGCAQSKTETVTSEESPSVKGILRFTQDWCVWWGDLPKKIETNSERSSENAL
jgi:hypothetical protein